MKKKLRITSKQLQVGDKFWLCSTGKPGEFDNIPQVLSALDKRFLAVYITAIVPSGIFFSFSKNGVMDEFFIPTKNNKAWVIVEK